MLPEEFKALNADYYLILGRELRRFVDTIKKLVHKNGFDEMVVVKKNQIYKIKK